jgi:hypothetical protein
VEKVVNIYKSVTRFPTPSAAEIFKKDQSGFSILSKWSQNNFEAGKKVVHQQIYGVNCAAGCKVTAHPAVEINEYDIKIEMFPRN